jgi:hypothetical protein
MGARAHARVYLLLEAVCDVWARGRTRACNFCRKLCATYGRAGTHACVALPAARPDDSAQPPCTHARLCARQVCLRTMEAFKDRVEEEVISGNAGWLRKTWVDVNDAAYEKQHPNARDMRAAMARPYYVELAILYNKPEALEFLLGIVSKKEGERWNRIAAKHNPDDVCGRLVRRSLIDRELLGLIL